MFHNFGFIERYFLNALLACREGVLGAGKGPRQAGRVTGAQEGSQTCGEGSNERFEEISKELGKANAAFSRYLTITTE
jgi:hypothetical protein